MKCPSRTGTLQGLHIPVRQPFCHRLDRLPRAIQHQPPQITVPLPPLILPRHRGERLLNELRQLASKTFHRTKIHTEIMKHAHPQDQDLTKYY